MSGSSHCGGQVLSDDLRGRRRRIAGDGQPVRIHQKLGEIPCDVLFAGFVRLLSFQPAVKVTGASAVDLDFCEHRKIDLVAGSRELENFSLRSRFLSAELVAGKCQNREALAASHASKRCLQSTQPGVLRRQSSATGDVDNQAGLAVVSGELHGVAVDVVHGQFMEEGHHLSPLGQVVSSTVVRPLSSGAVIGLASLQAWGYHAHLLAQAGAKSRERYQGTLCAMW